MDRITIVIAVREMPFVLQYVRFCEPNFDKCSVFRASPPRTPFEHANSSVGERIGVLDWNWRATPPTRTLI